MTDDATTARRKAMATAIKAKLLGQLNRGAWDSARIADELAEAADVAAGAARKEAP